MAACFHDGELAAWQQAELSEPDVETRAILEEIVADLAIQLNKR